VEKMKLYIFKRENSKFDDMKKDPVIKKKFKTIMTWRDHIMLGTDQPNDETESYLLLKFGDELITKGLIPDLTPVPYVDYMPDPNRPEKFKNVYK
jgi:hypothetical protein